MISAGNMGGRLLWASVSDVIGRRNVFHFFTLTSIPLYLSIPYLVESVVTTQELWPLQAFVVSTVLAVSIMGGTYAIMPAYESDIFGSRNVGAIHGRMLLASSAAAICGPSLLLWLRGSSELAAIRELLTKVDPVQFQKVFGAPISEASQLIEAKTLSIAKLMSIAPTGTIDPTPFIYNSTMYAMAGLLAIAVLSHSSLKPVDFKYLEADVQQKILEAKNVENISIAPAAAAKRENDKKNGSSL
jgi:hypothetical protein